MTFRVIIQRRAEAEINEAYDWIAERAPRHALRWLDGIQRAISTLETNPRRCPRVHEVETSPHEVRQLLYGRRRGVYRILFLIRAETVSVISVRHIARQPPPLAEPLEEAQGSRTPQKE